MGLTEEFNNLTNEYDETLFKIFKRMIDDAIEESNNNNFNSIDTFINVHKKIKYAYIELALATGIIVKEEQYNEAHNSLIISEKLQEKIYAYVEPVTENARNAIKLKAENILWATTIEELQEEYNALFTLLSDKIIQENDYVYKEIELNRDNMPSLKKEPIYEPFSFSK